MTTDELRDMADEQLNAATAGAVWAAFFSLGTPGGSFVRRAATDALAEMERRGLEVDYAASMARA